MNQKKKYLLSEDILSNYFDKRGGKPIVYGKRGEKVTEISNCGNVLIVENKDGNRFPVSVEKVNEL